MAQKYNKIAGSLELLFKMMNESIVMANTHMPQESVQIMRPASTTSHEAALHADEHPSDNLCMQRPVSGICMQGFDPHVVTVRQCFRSLVLQQALLAHEYILASGASYMSCTMG